MTPILTQFNIFSGSQEMGAIRSFILKFCTDFGNSFLCVDLLSLYLITAILRDNVFLRLAAVVADSQHNDADGMAKQIVLSTQFKYICIRYLKARKSLFFAFIRIKRDAEFLWNQLSERDTTNGKCLSACIIIELNRQSVFDGRQTTEKFKCKFIEICFLSA